MKFDKILEYQALDQKYMDLEKEVISSPAYKAVYAAKIKLAKANDAVKKLIQEAGELRASVSALKAKTDALKQELDDFDGILDGVQDAQEADHYIKMINGISDKINQLDKESKDLLGKIDENNKQYAEIWAQGVSATEEYNSATARFAEIKTKYEPEMNDLQQQLKALQAKVPEEFMKAYKVLRAQNKYPVFVEYDPKTKICTRCRMELANDTLAKLKNPGDYAECPHCLRVLFIPAQD